MKRLLAVGVLCLLLVSCGPPQDGHGTYEYDTGTYVGEFKHGKAHGQGTYTFADGTKYVGEFKDGEFHGQGTYTYAEGDKYVGEFKDGLSHGQGTYTDANGDKYVGEFKNFMFHGQGTVTLANGDKYVGEFKDDRMWEGTHYDKDGDVVGAWSEGVKKMGPTDTAEAEKLASECVAKKYKGC